MYSNNMYNYSSNYSSSCRNLYYPKMSPISENDTISTSYSTMFNTQQLHPPHHPPNFLFNFPPNSPNMMYMEYGDEVYLQYPEIFNQHQPPTNNIHPNQEINVVAADTSSLDNISTKDKELSGAAGDDHDNNDIEKGVKIVRKRSTSYTNNKRSSKKDRHSKINTANGPRDRRMRLSLDIAHKFFDLQDLLGYDKASGTVEWLLNSSSAAIKELFLSANSAGNCSTTALSSSNCDDSYCEVVSIASSTITTTATTKNNNNNNNSFGKLSDEEPPPVPPPKSIRSKKSNGTKAAAGPCRALVAKESRTKARDRAKERTSQKRQFISNSTSQLLIPISTDTRQQPSLVSDYHSAKNVANMQAHEDRLSSDEAPIAVSDSSLAYTGPWNPSSHFSVGILHNQQQQLPEFQFCGKAWETYTNIN